MYKQTISCGNCCFSDDSVKSIYEGLNTISEKLFNLRASLSLFLCSFQQWFPRKEGLTRPQRYVVVLRGG